MFSPKPSAALQLPPKQHTECVDYPDPFCDAFFTALFNSVSLGGIATLANVLLPWQVAPPLRWIYPPPQDFRGVTSPTQTLCPNAQCCLGRSAREHQHPLGRDDTHRMALCKRISIPSVGVAMCGDKLPSDLAGLLSYKW